MGAFEAAGLAPVVPALANAAGGAGVFPERAAARALYWLGVEDPVGDGRLRWSVSSASGSSAPERLQLTGRELSCGISADFAARHEASAPATRTSG